jgi:uncharacterized protein (DUF433 family)
VPNYQQLRTDRAVIEQAAAHLRRQAILSAYTDLEHKALRAAVLVG